MSKCQVSYGKLQCYFQLDLIFMYNLKNLTILFKNRPIYNNRKYFTLGGCFWNLGYVNIYITLYLLALIGVKVHWLLKTMECHHIY